MNPDIYQMYLNNYPIVEFTKYDIPTHYNVITESIVTDIQL